MMIPNKTILWTVAFDSTSNKLEIKLNFSWNWEEKKIEESCSINRYDIHWIHPQGKANIWSFLFAFANIFNLFGSKCFSNDITCISDFPSRLQTFVIKISICLIWTCERKPENNLRLKERRLIHPLKGLTKKK